MAFLLLMKELTLNEKSELTLDGKVVDARPIGVPKVIDRRPFSGDEIERYVEMYRPEGANAYAKSEMERLADSGALRGSCLGGTPLHIGHWITAVQYFEV